MSLQGTNWKEALDLADLEKIARMILNHDGEYVGVVKKIAIDSSFESDKGSIAKLSIIRDSFLFSYEYTAYDPTLRATLPINVRLREVCMTPILDQPALFISSNPVKLYGPAWNYPANAKSLYGLMRKSINNLLLETAMLAKSSQIDI